MAGRPKLPDSEKLMPLTIRMKPSGYSWLITQAAILGVSRSDFVRAALQLAKRELERGRALPGLAD